MSGPLNESDNGLSDDQNSEFLEIAALLSAFFSSDRDHRSLIPDVFEMLVRNLSLISLLYYSVYEKSGVRFLRLEYQVRGGSSLEGGVKIASQDVPFNSGILGQAASMGSKVCFGTGGELDSDPQLAAFCGYPLRIHPLVEKEKTTGLLIFVSDPDGPTVPEPFFQLAVNIFASYMLLVDARQESSRSKRKLTLLNSYRRVFSGSFDIRSVLSAFMNLTASVLGAEVGICLLFNDESPEPWLEINWGLSRQDLEKLKDSRGQPVLETVTQGEVLRRCSAPGEPPLYSTDARPGSTITSILTGGLFSKDELIGMIFFANKDVIPAEPQLPCFDEQDEELFEIVLEHARIFIENYLLYGKVIEVNDLNTKILESIDSGVLTLDLTGRILSSNRRAVDIASLAERSLIGSMIHDVFPAPGLDPPSITRYALSGRKIELQDYEYERGGLLEVISFILSPMRGEGKAVVGFVVTIQDRTEHVVLERQMRRADKLAALGELSAGLAHEIKNPLTAIKGFAQLLPSRFKDGEFISKFSKMLENELMRIDELTERLLTFARPNVGGMRALAVGELLEDAVLLAKYQLEKAGIRYEIEVSDPSPVVRGSPSRLSQVFLNIIINGLHAMKHGGVLTIRISRRFYVVPEQGGMRAVLIDFSDTGDGIPPDQIDRVFNPFFTTRESGTGLGLAISYRIIEEHNGVIEAKSRQGEGTRMRVVLPEQEVADA